MQMPDDAALEAAVLAATRNISVRVLFDWNRDGNFDHPYSDLSSVVSDISLNDQMAGDLPEEVSVTEGQAATELSMTLEGQRSPDELPVQLLFGAFMNESPMYGTRYEGTPVIWDIEMLTDEGPKYIRQFTGTVRTLAPKRKEGTVSIEAVNNDKLARTRVTLPRWAGRGTRVAAELGPLGKSDPGGPINASWVVNYALRKAGYYTGPAFHEAATAAWTFYGSGLPDIGHFRVSNYSDDAAGNAKNYWWFWEPDSLFGVSPNPRKQEWIDLATRSQTARAVWPYKGTGGAVEDSYHVWTGWVFSDPDYAGDPLDPNARTVFDQAMGDYQPIKDEYKRNGTPNYTVPSLDVEICPNGRVILGAYGYGKAAGTVWAWDSITSQIPAGWHYVTVYFYLWSPTQQIYASLFVDGENTYVTWDRSASTGTEGGGAPYPDVPNQGSLRPPDDVGNWCTNVIRMPVSHVAWHHTNDYQVAGELTQVPTVPTLENGARTAKVDLSNNYLSHIPDVQNTSVWEVLKEIAANEFAVNLIDEYGQYQFLNHASVRATALVPARRVTADHLEDFSSRKQADSHRNVISVEVQEKALWQGTVFTASKPDEFVAFYGDQPAIYNVPVDDVVSIYSGYLPNKKIRWDPVGGPEGAGQYFGDWAPAEKDTYYSYYEEDSVFMGVIITARGGPLGSTNWDVPKIRVFPATDQRAIRVEFWHNMPDGWNLHAALPPGKTAQLPDGTIQPSKGFLRVGGWYIDESAPQRDVVSDQGSIDQYGESILYLEANEWRSNLLAQSVIAEQILPDMTTPVPIADTVPMVGDPRIQLRDLLAIEDVEGSGPRAFAQVTGKERSYTKGAGLKDVLTLRILLNSGVGLWDDPALGIWDQTFTWS